MRYTISLFTASLLCAGATFAAPLRVVSDIAPVHSLVAMVSEGASAAPELVLPQGASAHDFQLRPSQARMIAGADLVIWSGAAMSPWMQQALKNSTASKLALLEAKGTRLRGFAVGDLGADAHDQHDHAHDHHDHAEAAHDDHHDHDHHGNDHGPNATDPHAWLNPQNASHWLGVIADTLAAKDPENAALYQENAAKYQTQIAALDAELQADLAPLKQRGFVVFHDAYGYFVDHYGLSNLGALRASDASAAGAGRLSALRAMITEGEVVCIFPERGQDEGPVQKMAAEMGLRQGAALDPEGVGLAAGPALYPALMRQLGADLSACLAAS